jgi:alkylhydroperoxidase/carboxymuconolactone decarboxylase family protein YurZ
MNGRGSMHVHERNVEKKRLNGLMLKSPMKVYAAFGELGQRVFADGALSKKQKELTALAIAVSQNCFD